MATGDEQRIDKWLFFARIVKSRSLAQKLVQSGGVRVNREKTTAVARLVRPGDILTISREGSVKVIKLLDSGARRGPAPEAATLYEDMTPAVDAKVIDKAAAKPAHADGYTPSARPPTKRERRALDRFRFDEG